MSKSISAAQVKTVIFACEAGMGSSLMSVNSLKKKLKAAQIADVNVVHKPVREVPPMRRWSWFIRDLRSLRRTRLPMPL